MKRALAIIAALTLLGACADRLDHLGRPPSMTAPGEPVQTVAPLSAQRAAIAVPRPTPPDESYAVASLWRKGPQSLFGDRRARRMGDILTVVIEIDDSATLDNKTTRSRNGKENVGVKNLLGLPEILTDASKAVLGPGGLNPNVDLGSSSSSGGTGKTARKEKLNMRVAATVTDVLPNGHLVIFGSQEARVNFELRDLQVAGVVRPEDISRRNEISYDKIADARIVYGGRGQITDLQQPRLGQQVVDMVLPF